MAGRGKVELRDKVAVPRVLMLNKANEWVSAVDPISFDKTIAGVSLGRTFGIEMAKANKEMRLDSFPAQWEEPPFAAGNNRAIFIKLPSSGRNLPKRMG